MVHIEESLQLPRDFEGFGEYGHDPQWPNGARIAVSFVLNYGEGGERNPLDGDGTSEPYLWEKGPSEGREQHHLNGEQDYEWLDIWDYSLEDDKAYIKRTCEALNAATGEFPEMGHKMLYTSEVYNEDSPYWIDLPKEKELPGNEKESLLRMSYNYDYNDGKFHMLHGFVRSNVATYEQYLKDTFDCLYREGEVRLHDVYFVGLRHSA
ncbi:hypothetical protein E8E11_005779 [Didymella keratinophila]|nr:hypothetical protein E8E11_005779 [Didymella keratinophila]